MTAKLSICIPTYNRAAYLQIALESIVCQADPDEVEIVVSDNASTDDTEALVAGYRERFPNLVYHRAAENMGADRNFLKSVELASGAYCWFLGSDDALAPGAIATMLEEVDSQCAVYLCNRIDCDINLTPRQPVFWFDEEMGSRTFLLDSEAAWVEYLDLSRSLGAFFGYLTSLVFRRTVWLAVRPPEQFIGTGLVEVACILQMLLQTDAAKTLRYISSHLALYRTGNDSFLEDRGGWKGRVLLDLEGLASIRDYYFEGLPRARNAFSNLMRQYGHPSLFARNAPNHGEFGELRAVALKLYSRPFGFNIFAHASGNLGLGVAARHIIRLILEKNIPVAIVDVDPGMGRGGHDMAYKAHFVPATGNLPYAINLFIFPPPTIEWYMSVHPSLATSDALNVALIMWELPLIPQKWMPVLESLDAVVAESEFMRYALEFGLSSATVVSGRHPLLLPENIPVARTRFGLPDDATIFVSSFEPQSDPERKNPKAVVDAFMSAFPDTSSPVRLVLKVNNAYTDGKLHPLVEKLQARCERDPRVVFILDTMPYADLLSLYASCDVFVSLHRAEGLGLGLMEAMALGKPVIATGWSGNMSFMNHTNSCLVRYRLIPTQGTSPVYTREYLGAETKWADPSVEDAAAWMQTLAQDPALRTSIGQCAAESMMHYKRLAEQASFVEELQAIVNERRFLPPGSKNAPSPDPDTNEAGRQAYQQWIRNHALQEIDGQLYAERLLTKWQTHPVFNLIMKVRRGQEVLLADTLDSLSMQMYAGWRLTVVADFPSPDTLFEQVENLQWIQSGAEADDWVDIANEAARNSSADWVALVPPGIRFEPHFFISCGDYINIRPEWRFIYTDEDSLNRENDRLDPKFKPDFNLDMLRSTFYLGEGCLIRKDVFEAIGGVNRLPGAENYDLALRVLDHCGEESIGHIAEVLYHVPLSHAMSAAVEGNGRSAVTAHLARRGIHARVTEGYLPGTNRVEYLHSAEPSVAIIIPTRDKLEFLQPCVEGVLKKTSYGNFRILVMDNQSSDPDVIDYFHELPRLHGEKVRVIPYDHEFNYAAICNRAAAETDADYLLFLNNDTQVLHEEWLSRMMSHAQRPEVGMVGARLVFPETGKVQHVGVVLGLEGVAEHPYAGLLDLKEPGYMGRAQIDQNFSAVTGACQLVRRSVYEAVQGMDEEKFKVSYNDIDLCLKVVEAGYKIVWTPYATLVHHGSVTQKSELIDLEKQAAGARRFKGEREAVLDKWLPRLASDPAYNRHLSLAVPDFRVESSVVLNWDTNFHDRPRIFGIPLHGGSGDYRITQPFSALSQNGLAQCEYIRLGRQESRILTVPELARLAPDTLVVHAILDDIQTAALERFARFNRDVLKVYMLDDLITQVPEKNSFYRTFMRSYRDAKPRLRRALSFCDRLVVSTQPLADLCEGMVSDIRVIPNRLRRAPWESLTSARRAGKKPRVGWAGAQQHQGDLELIEPVVKALSAEVEWVFMGMMIPEIKPYVAEYHDFVPIGEYPEKLASLNLDLALAPLEINQFNEAKSNLRLLEYGILGWPVICTDVYPYRTNDAPVTRVPNEPDAWIEAVRAHLADLDGTAAKGDALRQWVLRHYILEDHLDEWLNALVRS